MPSQMLEAAVSAIYRVTVLHGRTAITSFLLYSLLGSLFDVQYLFHLRLGSLWFPGSLSSFSETETKIFLFFFFKGVWWRSHLQSIIWFSIENSNTFYERMSPPLAWKSVDFVVSGLLPGFSEIADCMHLLANSLGYRKTELKITPSLSNLSLFYWFTGGTKLW